MAAALTVWTSATTAPAESAVRDLVLAAKPADARYDSVSLAGCTKEEIATKLSEAFNRLVTMDMADTALHIAGVVATFLSDAAAQIRLLHDACASLPHRVTLHIIGLAPGLQRIFDAHPDAEAAAKAHAEAEATLRQLGQSGGMGMSYTLIDDYAANGAPIGFTLGSLERYIALIQTALLADYYKVLSQAMVSAYAGDNLAMGVASLTFDRKAASRSLLGRGFLEALDSVGINSTEINVQKAVHEAETFLKGIDERYPALFEREVRPLYKERGMDQGQAVAAAAGIIDKDLAALKGETLAVLTKPELSLPEKEAVLAMILGRDNESLRGMQYAHEGMLLDDACNNPIDLYVEAFNRCCPESGVLPLRGDYEALKKMVWNDEKGKFEESKENERALNPISEIKRLKQDIINTTSFMREKQDELAGLEKAQRQREDAEEIKSKWRKPDGALKEVEYKEQPLDEKYRPAIASDKIKDNVDLRKFFSPVKDQLNLGACTSFAVVAMYEAMMQRFGSDAVDMSPAFLYYYSNVVTGRPGGGSNYFEQLKVLGTNGVCREDLYMYDASSPGTAPSDKAQDDAKLHRALAAKQITLVSGNNKAEDMKRNHEMLTSALSEGYPVGISLKVFDNLGRNGAFVLHPEDNENAKEDGWHAMVIAGYSEAGGFYIVRNSWGADFGDNGYCYIPMAYIDDPDYLDFACIITDITDKGEHKRDVPGLMADFASAESEIRIISIRNAIAQVRTELKAAQNLYKDYYRYYQRLIMQLSMPKVQDHIRGAAEVAHTLQLIDVERKKETLEGTFVAKLKAYKRQLQKIIASECSLTLIFGLGWYYSGSKFLGLLCLICAGLCALTIGGYRWWKQRKRRELQQEIDYLAVKARRLQEELLEMQIRFHVAGMWLRSFHKLSIDLNDVYDRLVSYISTLRAWQENYTRQLGEHEEPEGRMFRTLDASPLLPQLFEDNKHAIVSHVDLIRLFNEYQVAPDSIEQYHDAMRQSVTEAIDKLMEDFNLAHFLMGDPCKYLRPVSLAGEMTALVNVGQTAYRNVLVHNSMPTLIMLTGVDHTRRTQWENAVTPYFSTRPEQMAISDPTTLILLTLHPQSL